MLIQKKFYLLLFVLFAMVGIRATQVDKNLPKRDDSSTAIKAAKDKNYDEVSKLLDNQSITWSKEAVNELLYNLRVLKVPKEVLKKLFEKHYKMIELYKGYSKTGDTIFIHAARRGNIDFLKLIKQYFPKVDVNQKNKSNQTGFMYACYYGELETVKYLIDLGAKIDLIDNFKYTGFMRASQEGKINVVKYLLEKKGITLNQEINELQKSIEYAIQGDHDQVVDYLLKKFQDQFSNESINSMAQDIAQYGAIKVMEALLDINELEKKLTYGAEYTVDDILSDKKTLLGALIEDEILLKGENHKYRKQGKLAILKLLIEKKKIKLDKDHGILNPSNAIQNDQLAIAKYLIEHGGFTINEEFASELFRAAVKTARLDALKFLLNHDQIQKFFSLTKKDDDKFTLLYYLTGGSAMGDSLLQKRIEMLEWLDKQKKIDLKGQQGKDVVLLADQNRKFEIVLETLPKVEAKWTDKELNELLHNAIIYGRYKLAKWLLENSHLKDTFEITTKVPFAEKMYSYLDIFTNPIGRFNVNHSGRAAILNLLVQKCKIDLSNEDLSKKIWFNACSEDNQYILQYLLGNNLVKANIKNSKGQNGLIVAILSDHIPAHGVVEFLTEKTNINIDERDNDNQTAYHYAVKSKDKKVIDYLKSLKKGSRLGDHTPQANNTKTNQTDDSSGGEELKEEKKIEEQLSQKQTKKSWEEDLNQGKPTDFKFIAKVVVFLIVGIAVFLGLPYYFFTKKNKKIVAKS